MGKIHASLILEILGRPKENVSAALETVVNRLSAEKGVKVLNKKLHEPKPIEKSDLFTSFAEVEVELESTMAYLAVIFNHMPSNIQITDPEKIIFSNLELNEIGNALVQRLHHYDALAKNILSERNMLARKLQEVAPHLFKKPETKIKPETKPKEKKKSKKIKG
jgi:hypothetical protein